MSLLSSHHGNRSFSDVGGTPGGLGHFLIGIIRTCLGGYFLANQVSVVGSFWSLFGANTFGITLVPILIRRGPSFLERSHYRRLDS